MEPLACPVWREFNGIDTVDPLPAERRKVLVQIAGTDKGDAPAVAVGYLRYAAGDKGSPFFVVPGFGRDFRVTHWSDSLGDEFSAPLWHPPVRFHLDHRAREDTGGGDS
jgi:hypothetical protein